MIKGNLTEFSLGELFQIIAQGEKTGLLGIITTGYKYPDQRKYYIWFNKGRIIAISNSLDGKCLISLIRRRSWIKTDKEQEEILKKFYKTSNLALGLYLKEKKILTDHDLDFIFRIQIMRELNPLFQLQEADFLFKTSPDLPFQEMTGLSISAKELLLKGLRSLRDWSILLDKLPHATSSLAMDKKAKIDVNLDVYESKIWKLMESSLSLVEIAKKLTLTIEKVQKSAFSLILVGLAEEIPSVNPSSLPVNPDLAIISDENNNTPSDHFMSDLINFLQQDKENFVEKQKVSVDQSE